MDTTTTSLIDLGLTVECGEDVSIDEACTLFVQEVSVLRNLSPETVRSYANAVNSYQALTGATTVRDITIESIHRWSMKLALQGMSSGGRHSYLIGFRQFVLFTNRMRESRVNVHDIMMPKRRDPPRKFLSPKDVDNLLIGAGSYRDKAIIALLYSSGIRISELVSLNIGDIKDGEFTIQGKGGKIRPCYCDGRTRYYLKMYVEYERKQKGKRQVALFVGNKKGRLKADRIRAIIHDAGEFADLGWVTPHILRHSFATYMLGQGADIRVIQRFLGHSRIATTERYTHVVDADLRDFHKKYFR